MLGNLFIYLKHVILSNGNISSDRNKMKTNVYVVNLPLLLLYFFFNFWRIRGFQNGGVLVADSSFCISFVVYFIDNILLNYTHLTMNVEFLCDRCCRYFVKLLNLFNLYNKTPRYRYYYYLILSVMQYRHKEIK